MFVALFRRFSNGRGLIDLPIPDLTEYPGRTLTVLPMRTGSLKCILAAYIKSGMGMLAGDFQRASLFRRGRNMEESVLTALSDSMVRAAATAGASTVRVDGRKGQSASGTIYQPGWIIAASHAVERQNGIQIEMADGSQAPAQLVGRDPASDLCLLRVESQGAAAETYGEEAKVGQIVLALGRPTSEGIQASLGVVGAVSGPLPARNGRLLERFIRTDAIPYPGFSGGPLVDGDGHVLGINTSGFVPGASLAVPSGIAWQVAQALRQFGRMKRGFLGVQSQPVELPPDVADQLKRGQKNGLLLVGVERGQPADQAGLMVGDILVAFEGSPLEEHEQLLRRLAGSLAGKTVTLEVLRGGRLVNVNVKVGERE
jgi:S1-C subfamily serine protease